MIHLAELDADNHDSILIGPSLISPAGVSTDRTGIMALIEKIEGSPMVQVHPP